MRKAQAPPSLLTLKSHGSAGGVEVAGIEVVHRKGVLGLDQIMHCATFTYVFPSRPSGHLLQKKEGKGSNRYRSQSGATRPGSSLGACKPQQARQ